jgi:hypothetical protein
MTPKESYEIIMSNDKGINSTWNEIIETNTFNSLIHHKNAKRAVLFALTKDLPLNERNYYRKNDIFPEKTK